MLAELSANPDLLDRLRAALGVTTPAPAPAAPAPPAARATRVAQARAWLGAGWRKVCGACAMTAGAAARAVAAVRARWQAVRRFQVPLLRALTVGTVAGVAAYFASPWFAALASGLGGFTAMIAVQTSLWLRRTFAGPLPAAAACPDATL
jgi:hypothetical protein